MRSEDINFDSSLMFGDMVFEMTRSFNGEHFKLKEHIDRLLWIKILRINIPESKEDVYNLCIKTAEMNKEAFNEDDEHRLLIDVSRGVLGIYEGINGIIKDTIYYCGLSIKMDSSRYGKLFTTGINNVITNQKVILHI